MKGIKAIVFDCDGVMTDNKVFFGPNGVWTRFFNIQDGMGIFNIQREGFVVGVITGSQSEDVRARMKRLKIQHFYEGRLDKREAWLDFLEKTDLKAEEVAYMGDDVIDVPLLKSCGYPISVPNALPEAKANAEYITQREGGHGAVREVCELLIKNKSF